MFHLQPQLQHLPSHPHPPAKKRKKKKKYNKKTTLAFLYTYLLTRYRCWDGLFQTDRCFWILVLHEFHVVQIYNLIHLFHPYILYKSWVSLHWSYRHVCSYTGLVLFHTGIVPHDFVYLTYVLHKCSTGQMLELHG